MNDKSGFTIVELLVVIVVIGVLAAVSLVSYTGISQQAINTTLQSDLVSSSTLLKIYHAETGQYPASLDSNYCPPSYTGSKYCLKPTNDNILSYTSASPHTTFSLTATSSNDTSYVITDNSGPVMLVTIPLTAIAPITGTPRAGTVLTAGSILPAGATVSYQWQISNTSGGTYANISGANSITYTPTAGDVGKYIKLSATGTGSYNGTVISTASTVVLAATSVVNVNGTAFTIMPGAGQVMWGPDWWNDYEDTADITRSSFNLSAYTSGTITNASLSWNIGGIAGEGNASGYSVYLRRNDGTLITTWNATVHPSNSNAAGITTFANAGKGSTITFLWDSDAGNGGSNIWSIEDNMTNPVLSFTWTPQ